MSLEESVGVPWAATCAVLLVVLLCGLDSADRARAGPKLRVLISQKHLYKLETSASHHGLSITWVLTDGLYCQDETFSVRWDARDRWTGAGLRQTSFENKVPSESDSINQSQEDLCIITHPCLKKSTLFVIM